MEWAGSHNQAKMYCLLCLTLKAGMLSNSQNGQKERRGRERGREEGREGGRKERKKNEHRGDMCLILRNSSGSNLHIYDHSPE